jgi:hypothetical protein
MKRKLLLQHKFVEFLPDKLEAETLYVSIPYATAAHKCCCGCDRDVVTPISPTDWRLIFDGRTVSLEPSIGNWAFPCRSHYWIKQGKVVWAGAWSEQEVLEGKLRDKIAKVRYFAEGEYSKRGGDVLKKRAPEQARGVWSIIKYWLRWRR